MKCVLATSFLLLTHQEGQELWLKCVQATSAAGRAGRASGLILGLLAGQAGPAEAGKAVLATSFLLLTHQ